MHHLITDLLAVINRTYNTLAFAQLKSADSFRKFSISEFMA